MIDGKKLRVLFLCTGNACRSQMAEGWTRHLKGDVIEPYSAGVMPSGVYPMTTEVMAEAGVDIGAQFSKHVKSVMDVPFDVVVTVCGNAAENCPRFPGNARVIHVPFDDPPRLALKERTKKGKLDCYRMVRDQIKAFIETLPEGLNDTGA